MSNTELQQTPRTTLKRRRQRGSYDRTTINAILDEALIAHVGFVADGQPYVIPTIQARAGDHLYLHGSAASRMLRTLAGGVPVCVTVTIVDGLVLARSAFRHSMNYRSIVILATAVEVTDAAERVQALEAIVNHVVPNRWQDVRPPNAEELKVTTVLRVPITEASAKVRTGGPIDDPADLTWPCWAGQIPLRMVALEGVQDVAQQECSND